jgi:hypothetical protein
MKMSSNATMQPESYLKGPCENCGAHIEFPASGLGQSIPCPHCGWKTKLIQSGAPSIETSEAPAIPASKKRHPVLWMSLGGLGLAAALVFGIVAARKNAPPASPEKEVIAKKVETSKAEGTESEIVETSTGKKRPSRRAKKAAAIPEFESNGLQAFRVAIEKAKSSRLIYATGAIRNQSARQRFGVKVELDLFDESGAKLGSATDYVQVIEPHKEWKFRAMVTEPKVTKAKVAAITEE